MTPPIPDVVTTRDRSLYPKEFTWDLSHLYTSEDAWRRAKDGVVNDLGALEQFSGRLGESAGILVSCLDAFSRLGQSLSKLSSYASMLSDQDTRESGPQAMQQEIQQVYTDFSAKASFLEPEILRLDPATVELFLSAEKRLEHFRFYLFDILRRKEHTGTVGEEKILADAGLMTSSPHDIHSIFANADFPYPDATLASGTTVRLDPASFALHRASPERSDRQVVMASFFRRLHDYRRTFGTQLASEVKKNLFIKRARKHSSCLHAALDANNIPAEVVHGLIRSVNANLPTFHRYLNLRKRILKVDSLHYYDLYAPLLADVELSYTVEEAQNLVLASLQPLGEEYRSVVRKSFTDRWIDMFPSEGKRSGAYSNGSAYDGHPYILMNYNGKYDDVSTLTHELGHTMHSHYSNVSQPWITSNYSIFVAEVASTLNEALLINHLLTSMDDDSIRLSLLGHVLEGMKGTVFRQCQFAEYELAMHGKVEAGEPLTGDSLCEMYQQLVRRYYGHDTGVCTVDDEIQAEWAYIPHFYYNFYVYQYATSFTASAVLSERILAGDHETLERYMRFLKSGGSDYPINQLKAAGVDMLTDEPFALIMGRMNRVMDTIETLLTRLGQ